MSAPKRDPSPAEIREACAEIQTGWTPRERMSRLRSDLRPMVLGADGREHDVAAADYETHCDRGYQEC